MPAGRRVGWGSGFGHTQAAQANHFAVFGFSGNGQVDGFVEAANGRFATKHRCKHINGHVHFQVVAFTLEGGVGQDFDVQEQVAVLAAAARFALPFETDFAAVLDAAWDFGIDRTAVTKL